MIKIALLLAAAFALQSCTNTMQALENADYVCIKGEIAPIGSDSGAIGRGVKVPEDVVLTPELLAALCE